MARRCVLVMLAAVAAMVISSAAQADEPKVHVRVLRSLETPFVWRDPALPGDVAAIKLVAARNGWFSARLVVSSSEPIKDLSAKFGGLSGPAGQIPASAVQIRYSEPAVKGKSFVHRPANVVTMASFGRFDGLVESPAAQTPVHDVPIPPYLAKSDPQLARAAVQPVWLTVRVPADAAPGEYAGKLTIQAAGLAATEIPVQLKVHAWRVPDQKDFAVLHNLYQSHDSVALYYRVPLWSDRHFELMGSSLALAAQIANKFCVVHLIEDAFCMGNAQSMVRWIKQPDGSFAHDFTIFDRYLDLWAKANDGAKPATVLLSVWARGDDGARMIYAGKEIDMPKSEQRSRHKVTAIDPATGKTESIEQPPTGTPESLAFWKPVLEQVRARLEKRGWFDVTALGTGDDAVPLPSTVEVFRQIWPDGKWMSTSHMNPRLYKAAEGQSMPVAHSEHVWSAGRLYNPDNDASRKSYGGGYPQAWTRMPDRIEWGHPRVGIAFIDFLYDSSPLVAWRFSTEAAVQGNLNGIGRIGADFWPPPDRPRGAPDSLAGTTNLGPAYSTLAVLAPGPDGAIATERFEMFREGIQITEAIIAINKAVAGKKLSDELTKRCQNLLDERARLYMRAASAKKRAGDRLDWPVLEAAGWQSADDQLFALAGEVAAALGGK